MDILKNLWRLTTDDNVKVSVYTVLSKTSQLDINQMKFITSEIDSCLPDGADLYQFDLLSENIRFHTELEMRPIVRDIFWKVISESEKYMDKKNLVEHCIDQFIRYNRRQFLMDEVEHLALSLYERMQKRE